MRLHMIPVIFKEGIIASLTGGFYLDASQTHFSNLVHVYAWIILFVVPLVLFMISEKSHITAVIYSLSVGSFVLAVKLVIWRLHDLLDKSDPVVIDSQEAKSSYLNAELSSQHHTDIRGSDQEDFSNVSEIEDRCRRIGQAGIQLAELTDNSKRDVCPLAGSDLIVTNSNQSGCVLKENGICISENDLKPDLGFADSFTDSVTFPIPPLHGEQSILSLLQVSEDSICVSSDCSASPRDLPVVGEEQNSVKNKLNSLDVDYPVPSMCEDSKDSDHLETVVLSLPCAVSLTSQEQKRFDFSRSVNPRTPRSIYVNTPLRRSFIGRHARQAPVRKQFSETAVKNTNEIQRLLTFYDQTGRIPGLKFDQSVSETVNPLEKLPSGECPISCTSLPGPSLVRSSSVRTEIEQCKRIINQLKWDVSRLPPIPVSRFTASEKDLETLDLHPTASHTSPLSRMKSRSQLHRRALLMDWNQQSRTVTCLAPTGRNSIPYCTEFSLTETIFFWRQCFRNTNHHRLTRSNSRRQHGDMVTFNDFSLATLKFCPRPLPREWRSHSLRYNSTALNPLTPYHRQLVRLPGGAIRLRQQSTGSSSSAVTDISPLRLHTPEMNSIQAPRGNLHASIGSDVVEAVILEGQQVNKGVDIQNNVENNTKEWCILEETHSTTNKSALSEQKDECLEKNGQNAENYSASDPLVNAVSTDDNFQPFEQAKHHPLELSNVDKIPNDHNKLPVIETRNGSRLIRQAGFRRRTGLSSRLHNQPKNISLLQSENGSSSFNGSLQTEETKEVQNKAVASGSSSISLQTSFPSLIPTAMNPISVDQAVDNLLAHLMGVKSLAESGLTRQQCLLQLRGDGNAEDSENAEWDILYAVTEAATDTAAVLHESTVTNDETSNRASDTHRIVSSCGNSEENKRDVQELNVRTYHPIDENRQCDNEINTQEATPNLSNESGSDDEDRSSPNSLLWFFRRGFKPLRLQSKRASPTAPVHTLSLSPCLPFMCRVRLNRLQLGSVFDKSFTMLEAILSSILAALVSIVASKTFKSSTIKFYGIDLSMERISYVIECASVYILLIFPVLFCFGLIPQINTVLIYALEQLDIHIFGASGTTGLLSVVLSLLRTLIVIGITFIPCHYAVQKINPQCILFSVYWGAEIALCFLLSRLPSNIILYSTLLPSLEHRIYYWNRIRFYFYNIWYTLSMRPNLLSRSQFWSRKKKSQITHLDKPKWWKRLPLLIPNLHMKSTNAMITQNDGTTEELLLTRLSHTTGVIDVECGLPAHSFSLPCQLNRHNMLTQSSSTPALQYNLPLEDSKIKQLTTSPTTGISNWINSEDNENDESKKLTINSTLNNHPVSTLPSSVCQNVPESVSTPPASKDDSRLNTQQDQVTSSLLSDQQTTQSQYQKGDPLPNLIRASLIARFENDLLSSIVWFTSAFVVHFTSSFTSISYLQPYHYRILIWISSTLGFVLYYVWPNFRKPYPWLLLVKPIIKPDFQGRLIHWEVVYFWSCWLERNLLLPAVTMLTVTHSFTSIVTKFGPLLSTFIIIVTSMKMLRNGFCCAKQTYLSLFLTDLLFSFDFCDLKEAFPINYFFVSLLVSKFIELFRKLHFIYVYLAPFNIIWGSVAHAVVQLGSIPHSVFMFANCIFSTLLSAPLEPLMASAIFITSYVRPISFWETNHRTQRIETTNMPIAAQLKGISKHQVSGNLDGIFYEHLTRKLQRILAGDLQLGRLGGLYISHGDIFILSTDDLNLLIHIIEVGNGYVTYQLRGLEFIGTLCHASESETLRSDPHKNKRFCCCHSKTLHGMLSFNTAVRLSCMAWQFAYTPYIIEGYEVTDHSAGFTFQLTDLRKVLISRFVHCVIYFVCKLPNLSNRLIQLSSCLEANRFSSQDYFDLDPVFFKMIDDDFDEEVNGVTRQRFVQIYSDWISYCLKKHNENSSVPCGPDSLVVSLCLALSLLGRRCMGGNQSSKHILDQFLHGVHQVFSGDINLVPRDDWVLVDLDLLQTVVTPSIRIALKLYQDTFTWSSGNAHHELYKKIVYTEKNVVICQETDPKWRFAVLNDADCLFSFRWVSGRTSMDVYRIVQLTKRRLEFRAIKLNPECVRGLWAGQQREQIFLRNNNEERGSIQSANPVLRNLVNSSCDPPIGYPIYVSPLITSFAGDNEDYIHVCGGELSLVNILLRIRECWSRFCRRYCCSPEIHEDKVESTINISQSACNTNEYLKTGYPVVSCIEISSKLSVPGYPSTSTSKWSSKQFEYDKQTTLIALIHQQNDLDNTTGGTASSTSTIRDGHNFDYLYSEQFCRKSQKLSQILNEHLNKLSWPSKEWFIQSLTYSACQSSIFSGLEAYRVHRWTPNNPDLSSRSFCHRTIALLAFPGGPPLLDGHYVAIWEDKGVIEVNDIDDVTTYNSGNHNNNNNQFLMDYLLNHRD
ncbi:unnamed protein product [Heterobilharzia americana]|nr:unnamed protein product [Heterobilharzia americana]